MQLAAGVGKCQANQETRGLTVEGDQEAEGHEDCERSGGGEPGPLEVACDGIAEVRNA